MSLRQNTSVVLKIGPFLDSTDGFTPETGLTITQADIQISKNGAAYAQKNNSLSAVHDINGEYNVTLNNLDTDTAGIIKINITVAGALPVWERYDVVSESSYDALFTDGLNNFDPAADTVANVTTVATTTTNTDMRGTDNAATAANLAVVDTNVDSILGDTGTTIPAQISALNDFDPATDTVANVTLVATTTTNTDMRGTDGANTVAPDNAGITANGVAIAAQNDLSEAQVEQQVLDVMTGTPFAEPASVPGSTSTIVDKLNWIFILSRNKFMQTATTATIRNDGDSNDIGFAAVSDDGTTFTRDEYGN